MKFDAKSTEFIKECLQNLDENIYFTDFMNLFLNQKFDLDEGKSPKEELKKVVRNELSGQDRVVIEKRLDESIYELDPLMIKNNWFIKSIKGKQTKIGDIELTEDSYSSGELFLCAETESKPNDNYIEHLKIGYFDEDVSFPLISSNGRKWMSIIPHEISSMEKPIENAHGDVLVLGLGIGYYALSVARKENVNSVTIIENNKNVIKAFKECILPNFRDEEGKLRIIQGDAIKYYEENQSKHHYCFADIWHGEADGLQLYEKLIQTKKIETDYWIERSILSFYRRITLICLEGELSKIPFNPNDYDDFSRPFVTKIHKKMKNIKTITESDVKTMLSNDGLKRMLRD